MVNTLVAHMIDNFQYVYSIFFLFVPNKLMAIEYIWITTLLSPLRHLPTKAIREKYACGIPRKAMYVNFIVYMTHVCLDAKLCAWH